MTTDIQLKEKYQMLLPLLDEKSARLYLASEVKSMGRGARVKVAKLAGVSRVRINKGIEELEAGAKPGDIEKGKKITTVRVNSEMYYFLM
jgi:hypothetical protein